MPTFITTGSSTVTAGNNTNYVLFDDRSRTVTSSNGFDFGTSSASTLEVGGRIYGLDGVTSLSNASNLSTTVTGFGRVSGSADGFDMSADTWSINNWGEIHGSTGYGVRTQIAASDYDINNHGVIAGQDRGVSLTGDDGRLFNAGDVSGEAGVLVAGTNMAVLNSGTITGLNVGGSGITAKGIGVFTTTNTYTYLENSGLIMGEQGAYISENGAEDGISNSGRMVGYVSLGDNDDSYTGYGDGIVVGVIEGGDGNDTILTGNLEDVVDGGNNDDIIRGRKGDDELSGGDGLDRIFGGDDDDTLNGDAGNDRLYGDDGNDQLNGGADDDILRGGNGNDELIGGAGRDVKISGAGNDRFVFTDISDSVLGSSRDAVRDFESGQDFLDLEGIAGGNLRYIGTDTFSGTRAEVRHVTTAAGSSVVRVDEDGDGVRDMEFLVQFTPTLTESDFLI